MNINIDYYKILEISSDADADEIKKSYRKLSLKHHPDRNNQNTESIKRIQEINEAYEILGDSHKKSEYDLLKKNNGMPLDVNALFSQIFKGEGPVNIFGPGMPHPNMFVKLSTPIIIIVKLTITMEEVFNGTKKPVEFERWTIEGDTKTFEKVVVYIDIPKGIDKNEIIILKQQGNIINEQNKGDVKIIIDNITSDLPYERQGLNLIYKKTITLKESLCGFSFPLPYFNNKQYTIHNQAGCIVSPNHVKALDMGLTRGDCVGKLLIQFDIKYPEKLDEEVIETLSKIL